MILLASLLLLSLAAACAIVAASLGADLLQRPGPVPIDEGALVLGLAVLALLSLASSFHLASLLP